MQLLQKIKRQNRSQLGLELDGVAGWLIGLIKSSRSERRKHKQMQLLETLSLGGKRQLMLVSCGGEHFLVGGGLESVETIVRVNPEGSSSPIQQDRDDLCV